MLAEALRARGTKCIAVVRSQDLPKSMQSRFNPGVFQEIIAHDADYEQTVDALLAPNRFLATLNDKPHLVKTCS